ncbi:TusE/DsrC/DsvC family sulfur relay protein [Tessaracoccus sp. Z1128]
MPTTRIAGRAVDVNDEGFLTEYNQWDEEIAPTLAGYAGVGDLTEEHWKVLRFLRADYPARKETATLRRVSSVGGFDMKQLFTLFPGKPAKKMAYIAGLPKPKGCV